MSKYSKEEIQQLDRRYRANLLNSASGYKPANLIGSCDNDGNNNVAVFNSVVHIGADPALIGFILRPTTVARHTYENILQTGYYTINHIHQSFYKQAHQTSAKYEKGSSEFEACGLKAEYIKGFDAPFVKESQIKLGMKFISETLIEENGTRLIIGEVQLITFPDDCIEEDGMLRLDHVGDIAITGLSTYSTVNYLDKLPYAKTGTKLKEKPDNVVYDKEKSTYAAGLMTYATNIGAPAIVHEDVSAWKRRGINKVNHQIKTEFEALKSNYNKMMDAYQWNEALYKASYNFEPVVGDSYHAYRKTTGEVFLSLISPDQWNQEHLGEFKLNFDLMWQKVDA